MKEILHNPAQGHKVLMELWPKMKQALAKGMTLELEVTQQKRSQNQNEMFHSIIGEISKQATHAGSKWNPDDWKRLLIHKWAQETHRNSLERVVPALGGGGIVQLGLQSRRFSKEEASEFTDWLLAWSAENGVDLP